MYPKEISKMFTTMYILKIQKTSNIHLLHSKYILESSSDLYINVIEEYIMMKNT